MLQVAVRSHLPCLHSLALFLPCPVTQAPSFLAPVLMGPLYLGFGLCRDPQHCSEGKRRLRGCQGHLLSPVSLPPFATTVPLETAADGDGVEEEGGGTEFCPPSMLRPRGRNRDQATPRDLPQLVCAECWVVGLLGTKASQSRAPGLGDQVPLGGSAGHLPCKAGCAENQEPMGECHQGLRGPF